jgi:tetratricopeptide (TPR) repeat protein
MKKNSIFLVFVIVGAIVSGIGSIVFEINVVFGIILTVIGLMMAVITIIADNIEKTSLSQMIDIQNKLLASSGAGNVHQEIFNSELKEKGRSPDGIEHLIKAYNLQPNNVEIIKSLSSSLALSLSFSQWATSKEQYIKSNNWVFAKNLAEKGLKISNKEPILMDTMGILCDTAGEHEEARKWFLRSSKFRKDPFWHLLMSTSWGLSGNVTSEIKEIEQVIAVSGHNWFVDMYYGTALVNNGRCKESLSFLRNAQKTRGMHPGISYFRLKAYIILGIFSGIPLLDCIYLIFYLVIFEKWHSIKRIIEALIDYILMIISCISRFFWKGYTINYLLLEHLHLLVLLDVFKKKTIIVL